MQGARSDLLAVEQPTLVQRGVSKELLALSPPGPLSWAIPARSQTQSMQGIPRAVSPALQACCGAADTIEKHVELTYEQATDPTREPQHNEDNTKYWMSEPQGAKGSRTPRFVRG